MSIAAKYRAVGNGVPIPMAVTIARAVRAAIERPQGEEPRLCLCGCGRPAQGNQRAVTAACRKRMQRRRERGQV